MSKTMKILLPILIVFAVAAIAANVVFYFFALKPKRERVSIIEIPAKKVAPMPQKPIGTK